MSRQRRGSGPAPWPRWLRTLQWYAGTITSTVTLDHDLTCAVGNGITINSHNVVLDLGGHTITGGAPTPSGGDRRGGSVTFDHHGVVVRNGIIGGSTKEWA